MISKILVPTDGSKPAKKSIEYAVQFAEQVGATMVLLSVIDRGLVVPQTMPVSTAPTKLIEPIEDYLRRAAEAYVAEAEEICKKYDVQSKKVIRSGHPVEEIVKEAQRSKVDLIVIGSHGRSALKAAVLGSVAFGIINKETKIPVLVVRK
jgi:nucleotide-binding universal stress UspA family protein